MKPIRVIIAIITVFLVLGSLVTAGYFVFQYRGKISSFVESHVNTAKPFDFSDNSIIKSSGFTSNKSNGILEDKLLTQDNLVDIVNPISTPIVVVMEDSYLAPVLSKDVLTINPSDITDTKLVSFLGRLENSLGLSFDFSQDVSKNSLFTLSDLEKYFEVKKPMVEHDGSVVITEKMSFEPSLDIKINETTSSAFRQIETTQTSCPIEVENRAN